MFNKHLQSGEINNIAKMTAALLSPLWLGLEVHMSPQKSRTLQAGEPSSQHPPCLLHRPQWSPGVVGVLLPPAAPNLLPSESLPTLSLFSILAWFNLYPFTRIHGKREGKQLCWLLWVLLMNYWEPKAALGTSDLYKFRSTKYFSVINDLFPMILFTYLKTLFRLIVGLSEPLVYNVIYVRFFFLMV